MRPIKPRKICFNPNVTYFKPRGIPLKGLEEIELNIDELEALRLCDLNGLEQVEAAEKMNVSRSTIQRMISSARKKIADAIINGKAIKINNK
ncbi:MAG: hypothetical protein MCSN_0210 [Candidatus Microsyncoccus archaeolyticus]|jgi:predicted DNA-binding protein (UPF0251 family)|nr:MAG: hypothetical protein MCSN_0210 [Candidatus Parcubacteria bacterium]